MGNVLASIAPYSHLSQHFPPTPTFQPKRDIPDLTGKVAIVTGANSGIGYYTTKELLRKNAKVYLACRDEQRGNEAIQSILKELNAESASTSNSKIGDAILLKLELSDLISVKKAATEVLSREEKVDILINNAGVMMAPFEWLSKQGYDIAFGTNVLGHYYFTMLLMPAFERSTAYYNEKARVVNVSSGGHHIAVGDGIEWKLLKGGQERDQALKRLGLLSKSKVYGVSKMGNVLMANFMARHYNDKIASCSLNPGNIATNLQKFMSPAIRTIRPLLHSPDIGAYTSLFPATVVPADDMNGKYFQPWARFGRTDPRANNIELQDQLKRWLEDQVADFEKTNLS